MPLNPSHIAQIAILVRDLDRARRFYADSLGLAHLFDAPPGLSFFQCGRTRLMLSLPETPDSAGSSILYYAVEDAAEAQRQLAADGVEFEEDARYIARVGDKDVWLAVCGDGEGNLLGLMSEQAIG